MSLQNTTKENFFTPAPTIGKFEYMEIYGSAESTEEEELDDLGNAKGFREYMEKRDTFSRLVKGSFFGTTQIKVSMKKKTAHLS